MFWLEKTNIKVGVYFASVDILRDFGYRKVFSHSIWQRGMKWIENHLATILPQLRPSHIFLTKHCLTLHANMFEFTQQLTRSTLNCDTIVNILEWKCLKLFTKCTHVQRKKFVIIVFLIDTFLHTIDTCLDLCILHATSQKRLVRIFSIHIDKLKIFKPWDISPQKYALSLYSTHAVNWALYYR